MPPHGFFGLSWAEILAIMGIIAALYAGVQTVRKAFKAGVDAVKSEITNPLAEQIGNLATKVDSISGDHKVFDHRLDKHDVKLARHDVEIGTVFHAIGLTRKDDQNDEN